MLRQCTFGEQAVRWEACHRKTNLKMGQIEGQCVERCMSTSTALSALQLSHNFTFRRSWGSSLVRADGFAVAKQRLSRESRLTATFGV